MLVTLAPRSLTPDAPSVSTVTTLNEAFHTTVARRFRRCRLADVMLKDSTQPRISYGYNFAINVSFRLAESFSVGGLVAVSSRETPTVAVSLGVGRSVGNPVGTEDGEDGNGDGTGDGRNDGIDMQLNE